MGDWSPSCSTLRSYHFGNVANAVKSSRDPSMMDVDLGDVICMASSST